MVSPSSTTELVSWLIIGSAILGPPAALFGFVCYFKATRCEYEETVVCPEGASIARIHTMTRMGTFGPYRDIQSCSLLKGKAIDCGKSCLKPNQMVSQPFTRSAPK